MLINTVLCSIASKFRAFTAQQCALLPLKYTITHVHKHTITPISILTLPICSKQSYCVTRTNIAPAVSFTGRLSFVRPFADCLQHSVSSYSDAVFLQCYSLSIVDIYSDTGAKFAFVFLLKIIF